MELQSLDLVASYGPDSTGMQFERLVGRDGKLRLGRRMWETGLRALDVLEALDRELLARIDNEHAEFPLPEGRLALLHRLPVELIELVGAGEGYLDDMFFPDLQDVIAQSGVELRGADGLGAMDASRLFEVWREYDFAAKVELYGRFMWDVLPALKERPELVSQTQRLSAIAVLVRLDDALIADSLDGRGLDEVVADIESLRLRLAVPSNGFAMINAVLAWSRENTAKAGAMARHAENHAMKRDVFAWLDANFARYRSMDAAATEIQGKVVPVTWRTARDWVAEWKKVRSASKP